jgi:uncharacterized protein YbjT (DUF2867 family)
MILVVGATGNVGAHVVRRLVAMGERPRALVRDPDKARDRLGGQVEQVVGDLDRASTLLPAFTGVDRVFVVTTQSDRQVEQEQAVIEAASRAEVRHVVKLSVFRADDNSPLQIARQHRQAERALERSGLSFTILRPPFFMQNLLGMVRNGAVSTAALGGRVAMIDARDVADVAVAALMGSGHEGMTYTPTGPEALSFDEVAQVLTQQTGTQIRHVRVSPEEVGRALRGRGMAHWYAEDMAKLHGMLADGYEEVVTDDFRTVTGTGPHPLARFAKDFSGVVTERTGDR